MVCYHKSVKDTYNTTLTPEMGAAKAAPVLLHRMKQTDPFYLTTRWKHLREAVLRRDQYICQECKRYGKRREAALVHHAVPRRNFPELEWSPWNLISLCPICHEKMHLRASEDLSLTGIALARRMLKKAGKDDGYLRELERRRTEGTRMV